jgi:hypothetical protein
VAWIFIRFSFRFALAVRQYGRPCAAASPILRSLGHFRRREAFGSVASRSCAG